MDEETYLRITRAVAGTAAAIVFIGSYIYCIAEYGYLFGVGLGWLPSGIVAIMTFFIAAHAWVPIVFLLAIAIAWFVYERL